MVCASCHVPLEPLAAPSVAEEGNLGFPFPSQDFADLSCGLLPQLHPSKPLFLPVFSLKQTLVYMINATQDLAILFIPFTRP